MTLPKGRKTAIAGRLVSYARVATDEQGKAPQRPSQTFAIVLVICVGKKGYFVTNLDMARPMEPGPKPSP